MLILDLKSKQKVTEGKQPLYSNSSSYDKDGDDNEGFSAEIP